MGFMLWLGNAWARILKATRPEQGMETSSSATGVRGMLPENLGKDVADKLKKEVLDRLGKGPQA